MFVRLTVWSHSGAHGDAVFIAPPHVVAVRANSSKPNTEIVTIAGTHYVQESPTEVVTQLALIAAAWRPGAPATSSQGEGS